MLDVITPAEAFRRLYRARYGQTDFLEKITSKDSFRTYSGIPEDVIENAHKVLKELRDHVKEGNIRLRGERSPQEWAVEIDGEDRLRGELGVFEQTLSVYDKDGDIRPARTWKHVFCVEADVRKLFNKAPRGRPQKHDWPAYKERFLKLLEERGDFRDPDQMPDWNSRAEAAKTLRKQDKRDEDEKPEPKTVERQIKTWMEEHDRRQARGT